MLKKEFESKAICSTEDSLENFAKAKILFEQLKNSNNRRLEELVYSIDSQMRLWPENITSLINPALRNFEQLITPAGFLREPKITIYIDITDKGNFAVKWKPTQYLDTDDKNKNQMRSDFNVDEYYLHLYASHTFSGRRHSELSFIKNIDLIMRPGRIDKRLVSYLWLSIIGHFRNIASALETSFTIELESDFEFDYNENGEIEKCRIINLVERKKERAADLILNFHQYFEVSAEEFLRKLAADSVKLYPPKFSIGKINNRRYADYLRNILTSNSEELSRLYEASHKAEKLIQEARLEQNKPTEKQKAWQLLSKEELEKLVWSTPATEVALMYDISETAVRKKCKKFDIKTPGRGYWQRINSDNMNSR